MNNVASLQVVKSINSIPNADFIEVLNILGWSVVSRKGDFKEGDLCVFFEIDALLPLNDDRFKFLKDGEKDTRDFFKIRTIKLRKQISQGIALPLYLFSEIQNPEEGMDVTGLLKIGKYEKSIPSELQGKVKGSFPNFLEKTDEENVQNCKTVLFNAENRWYLTEKIDGSSITFYHINGDVGVCSRNVEKCIEDENDLFVRAFKELKIEEKLKAYGKNIALQGELIHSKIQENKYKLLPGNLKVFFFTIYNINSQQKLNYEDMVKVLKELNLQMVPVIGKPDMALSLNIDNLLILAEGGSKIGNTEREGIVCRNYLYPNISFKVLNRKFLVKYAE
jgi:RNA ligase (TIGR02306 family)